MDNLQRILLSFGIIIISSIFIYLLIILYKRTSKKMHHNKMITMNLVIKYNPFIEYLEYQRSNKERFNLFLLKINNLNLQEDRYSDYVIKSYLRMIAKELSVYLPFGGKIAQTNNRDTFIIYYPKTNEDDYLVGERFKSLATKSFSKSGVNISKTNSLSLISDENYSLKHLGDALVNSVRKLGEMTVYSSNLTNNTEEYINVIEKLKNIDFTLHSFKVNKINDNNYTEIYSELNYDNLKIKDFLSKFSSLDQSWINLYMVEYLMLELYANNIYNNNISIPLLLKTFENELLPEVLEKLVIDNKFLLNQVIISIKLANINNEEQVIKNILTLRNLGVKFSLELDSLSPTIYSFIQKYHIDRLEVNDALMNDSGIAELLYFAKVNHLEVIYKTQSVKDNLESLNVSHITSERMIIKETVVKRKRGRK